MMKYIIFLLLLSSTLTAQTKLRQIERSATKWHVPAAWDSIPGVTGHAMKYIDLETLMDTVGIQQFGIDSLDYRNDSLLIWVGGGYYFAIIPQGLMGSGDDGSVAYWHQDTIAGDTAHYWDRTNKRLGLNTKSPTSLLHVKKNEYALPVAEFDNPGTNGQTVLIKHGSSSDGRYPLKIQTPAGTSYFDARGYLGLGVSPSYPLHVKNTTGISRFENTNSNGDAGFDLYHANKWWRIAMNAEGGTTNNVHFRDITGSRYPLTLQSSNGYVGILNISPARELHVTGRVRVSTLDSDLTPPTTAGPTKMVITDESGDLSFANIPTVPADSTVVTQGFGITVTESPTNTYNVKSDTSKMATIWDVSQVDQSATNELQTLSHSNTSTTHTTTLSNSGGSLILKEGSNVTLTTSGNEVTIASTGGGGIDSTNIIGGWGIESVESPANTFNLIADSTQVASQYDLTLKQDKLTLTTTGTSGAATLVGSTLNVPQYQAQLTNPVTGTGTTNYVSKFTGTSTLGNSQIQDNGTTVGIGALDASYKFYQDAGDAKIGGSTGYHRLFFGDGTNVYVGEFDLTNRLYLRGGSMTLDIGGSRGTNGQVLTSNGASVSWQTPTVGTVNLGYTASPTNGLVTISGGGTSATLPLATTTNAGLLKPLSNFSTQFLNGLGNWTTPSGDASLTLSGTSNPIINTSTAGVATGVQFVGSGSVTVSGNTNTKVVTITGTGGGVSGSGTNTQVAYWSGTPATLTGASAFLWDNSNSRLILGAPTTPSRTLDVNGAVRLRTVIANSTDAIGNLGDNLMSNGPGAWFWQHDGNYTFATMTSSNTAFTQSLSTTYGKIDFTGGNSNNIASIDSGNDQINLSSTNGGTYEITYSGSFKSNTIGAYNICVHKTTGVTVSELTDTRSIFDVADTGDYYNVSKTSIIDLANSDKIDLRIKTLVGTATATMESISIVIKRLK